MTSITIGIFQGAVISKPIKIILISAIVATYSRRQRVSVFLYFVVKGIRNDNFLYQFGDMAPLSARKTDSLF